MVDTRVENDKITVGHISLPKGDVEDANRPEIHYLTGIRFYLIITA
jgi:hypothetical protein